MIEIVEKVILGEVVIGGVTEGKVWVEITLTVAPKDLISSTQSLDRKTKRVKLNENIIVGSKFSHRK